MARKKKDKSLKPVPHVTDSVEEGCPLPASHGRLEEVHYFWHETADHYMDPEAFRYNLNALIQSARNVTFALQSEKARAPDFDTWYAEWQERMRADSVLRWLSDARTTVVKRGDLEGQSIAKITVLTSYADPPALEDQVPPGASLDELAQIAISVLPRQLKEDSILVVERRWVAQSLPTREVLDALAYAYGFLFTLLRDAHKQIGAPLPPIPDRPTDGRLPCMVASDIVRSLRINLRTGQIMTPERLLIQSDPRMGEEAARRYQLEEAFPHTDDPVVYAEHLVQVAKQILTRDKTHVFIVHLHHPDGRWEIQNLAPESPEEKLLLWRRVAADVEAYGFDAYIAIAEAWMRPVPGAHSKDKGKRKASREEALLVNVETADGRSRIWIVPFRRRFGRIVFSETQVVDDRPLFSEPIRKVWSKRPES